MSETSQDGAPNGGEVADLPMAFGRRFRSLDEYLAHLQRYAGPIGRAWYREIRPGVYELQTNMAPPPEKRVFTREELEQRFRFTR